MIEVHGGLAGHLGHLLGIRMVTRVFGSVGSPLNECGTRSLRVCSDDGAEYTSRRIPGGAERAIDLFHIQPEGR
jgi:hypothetical protein